MATSAAYIDLDEGAAPSAPPSATARLYTKADGLLYWKDDANTEYPVGSSSSTVATDPIWDAAGDLAVGSGANTAARLAIGGTNGMSVQRVSGAVAWALPPGFEFDYAALTSDTAIAAASHSTEATALALITGASVAYDGSTVILIEFFGTCDPDAGAAGRTMSLALYDGSSSIGILTSIQTPAAAVMRGPVHVSTRITPSAASHQYSIRGYANTGTANVRAGTGGVGNRVPAYMRITKV